VYNEPNGFPMTPRAPHRIALREYLGVAPEVLASLGLAAHEVLDLCSGLNPYGPPASVLGAARDAPLTHYPDPTGHAARARVAQRFGTSPDCVVLGSGAAELLWSCARVLIEPGMAVLTMEPGYPEFRVAARQLGARLVQWRSVERTGHRIDLQQIAELMRLETPAVLSLCAPGSPTGSSVRFTDIALLAARFPDTHVVVDQSLLALSDDHADLHELPASNVICIRSLSKELGLPGVRAAYLLADAKLAARIEATRPAFSTSSQTQAVIQAAMDEDAFSADSRLRLQADRTRLMATLDALGLVYTPSVAPFLLVRVARASEVAAELLERHRIAVCDATASGLPDHLRISAVSVAAAVQLSAALSDIIERRRLTHGREA
jgi:histidinol-phosphate/aromatic aminotransferase/cobyric acid decarboxylase-like protein